MISALIAAVVVAALLAIFWKEIMFFINPYVIQPPAAAGFTCDAAKFDGANDYITRQDLTGLVDSKKGSVSLWVRFDNTGVQTRFLVHPKFYVERTSGGKIRVQGADPFSHVGLNVSSVNSYGASATWRHILISFDLGSGLFHMYVNDSDDAGTPDALDNETIDFVQPINNDWSVGGPSFLAFLLNGALAEVYFIADTYIDFSVEANRRKFIDASGKPADLGSDGSTPTGTAPHIYLHLDDGEAVANFAVNRSGAGDFSIVGTLDAASTSPSD